MRLGKRVVRQGLGRSEVWMASCPPRPIPPHRRCKAVTNSSIEASFFIAREGGGSLCVREFLCAAGHSLFE